MAHNLGLNHANYWRTDSVRPFGKDSFPGGYVLDTGNAEWLEYGHYFSLMSAQMSAEMDDPTKPHYTPVEKAFLGWLSGSAVHFVGASGTNRLFRHDHKDTVGTPRAIRIETPATDYTGYGRYYWLGYRFAPWAMADSWLQNGIQIDVARASYTGDGATLLDMTPYSSDSASPFFNPFDKPGNWWMIDNNDKLDSALIVGRTYNDSSAGIHITPVATGKNGTHEEYIDVVIHLGSFVSNRPPVISSSPASTNVAAIGQPISFSITATDPDGDTLAYSWDFDEAQVWTQSGINSSTATRSWSSAGRYRVTATVSDMKGGIASKSMVVTVGAPLNNRQILGRVIWGGQPVFGARVHTGDGRQAWTKSDGTYVFTGLASTNAFTLECAADGLTFSRQFSNPVVVLSGDSFGKDFYAVESLPVRIGLPTYSVSGHVSYAGEGVAEVELGAGGLVVTTDWSGDFQFTNLTSGTYSLIPRKENWSFAPATRTIVVNSNLTGIDFSRDAPYSITGRIDGLPAGPQDSEPKVSLSNGRTVLAESAGNGQGRYWAYTLTDVPAGQHSIQAALYGYRIVPAGFSNLLTIAGDLANINFSATAASVNGSLSGRITEKGQPLVGVSVQARKAGVIVGSNVTDSDGYYMVANLGTGAHAIEPLLAGFVFSPATLTSAFAGTSYNDFLATGPTQPPVISNIASVPSTVPDTSSVATLSVSATGTGPLTYSWEGILAHGPVTFGVNNSTNGSSTTVTFVNPGAYTFRVRVTDVRGLASTSVVSTTVSASLGAMVVAPYEVSTSPGATVSFHADAWDQLGNRVVLTPVWSVSGGGSIDGNGVFIPTTPGGPYTVTAVSGALSATALVSVVNSFTHIELTHQGVLLRFTGAPGLTYAIERSTNLTSWAAVGVVAAPATGVVEFTDEMPSPETAFYRAVTP